MAIVFLLFTLASIYFSNNGVRATVPGAGVVKPAVSLDEAIRIVRTNFEIPAVCTGFTSGYNGNAGSQFWFLQWTAQEYPGLDCSAQVDAASGEVLNFSINRPEGQPGITLREPAVSIETARVTATRLMHQVDATHITQLRPVQDDVNILNGPVSYTFHWERAVNGVPFPANGVSVQVSGDDGWVTGYTLTWVKTTFPDADRAISTERARQVFENAGMLELQYYQPTNVQTATAPEKQPVLLVYRLVHPSGGVIDAIRGVPFVSNAMPMVGLSFGVAGAKPSLQNGAAFHFTPQELTEIHKIAGFKTQDEAAAAVRKWVPGANALALQSAELTADYQLDTDTWDMSFKAAGNRPDDLYARVNALTGELVSFSYNPVSGAGQNSRLSRFAAQQMAEDFLRGVQPVRFPEVKLEPGSASGSSMVGVNYPPIEHFNYRRVVNGIPFPDNYLAVDVDTHDRRIVNYELIWSNPVFPVPQSVLSLQQADDAFLKQRTLTLIYVRDVSTGNVNLVYQPQTQPSIPETDLLDASTGTALDYKGHPVTALAVSQNFTDIAGVPEAKEIALLGQAGIFNEYGDAFHPKELVTASSLLRAMLVIKNGRGSYEQASDQDVLKQAGDCGWLKEDLQPASRITREEMARIIVRMLGLERAAETPGIYRVPFADAGSIASDDTGYVALAWGMGIMKEDGSMFHPEQPVTRAEAAAVLVRAFQ
jgi:hypothetical protein